MQSIRFDSIRSNSGERHADQYDICRQLKQSVERKNDYGITRWGKPHFISPDDTRQSTIRFVPV